MHKIQSLNPATNKLLGEVDITTEAELIKTVQNAHFTLQSWQHT